MTKKGECVMDRRAVLRAGFAAAAGTAAVATSAAAAKAGGMGKTAFVLVHGSWHGAWCWGLVEPRLNQAGHMSVAIDLPGHGLDAVIPESFRARPLDPAAFGAEPSALAGIGIDSYADAVIAAADRAKDLGADRVVAVGHSMGGVPVTFAAAKSPEKFAGLVYIAALLPTPGKPAGFYTTLEEQVARNKFGPIFAADPAVVGALRFDPRTEDPTILAAGKEALAADVDDALWATAMHLFTPDAPAAMYGEMADFPQGFGALEKTFIRCTQDQVLIDTTCDVIVEDLNSAWPSAPTALVDIEASHEVMFSKPDELADLLIAAA